MKVIVKTADPGSAGVTPAVALLGLYLRHSLALMLPYYGISKITAVTRQVGGALLPRISFAIDQEMEPLLPQGLREVRADLANQVGHIMLLHGVSLVEIRYDTDDRTQVTSTWAQAEPDFQPLKQK